MYNKNKTFRPLYFLVFLDILILPYFQILIIPLSLIFVSWLFVNSSQNYSQDIDFKIFFAIVICATVSTAVSPFILNEKNYILTNIKYLLQLVSSFFYFFVFKSVAKTGEIDSKTMSIPIYLFISWYTVLLISYFMEPYTTIESIKNIYGRTTVEYNDFLHDLRFPYLFSDPNTAIYFYLLAASFLNYLKPNFINLTILVLGGGMATLAAQSTGGIVTYVVILIWTIFSFAHRQYVNIFPYFLAIFFVGVISFSFISQLDFFENLQTLSIDRLLNEDRFTGGFGRGYHWANVTSLSPWPFGRGYLLYSEGRILPPHSDILGTIYRYGFLSTIFFMYFLFIRDKRLTVFSIAVLVPFCINAVIEDQKLFSLYLILIGYISGVREKQLAK